MTKKNNQTFSSGLSPYPSSSALAPRLLLPSLLALHGAPAGGVGSWASLLDQPISFPTTLVLFLSCASNADKMKSRCKPGMASPRRVLHSLS